MSQLFSVVYFKENFIQHIERNKDVFEPVHSMNGYYRSVISTLISDQLTKNSEIVKRIRNLEEAYNEVKNNL